MDKKIKNALSQVEQFFRPRQTENKYSPIPTDDIPLMNEDLLSNEEESVIEQPNIPPIEQSENERRIDAFKQQGVESLRLKDEATLEVQELNRKMLKNLFQGVKNPEQKIEDLWIKKVGDAALEREKRLKASGSSWIKEVFHCEPDEFWMYYEGFTEEVLLSDAKRDYRKTKDPVIKEHAKEAILAIADVFEEMEYLSTDWLARGRTSRRSDEEMMEVISSVDGKNFRAFLIASWEVRRRAWASEARFLGASVECQQGKACQDVEDAAYDLYNGINGPNGQLWSHFFWDFQWDSMEAGINVPKFCELAQKIISYESFLEKHGIPTHPPYGWDDESYGGNAQGTASTGTQ